MKGRKISMKPTLTFSGLCKILAFGSLLSACGAATPSQELMDARHAYDEARQSNASTLVPDQLLNARQALELAERAHDDDAQSFNEKSLAYIANRKAALAMAKAEMVAAQREILALDEAYKDLQDKLRTTAQKRAADTDLSLREKQEALKRANQELAEKGTKLSDQEAELKKRQAEIEAKSKQLALTASDLEKEKAARLDAEKRAAEALANLKEIAKIKEEQRGLVITLEGAVLFTTGKTTLLPIAQNKLSQVAAVLKQQNDNKRIVVEGHTDSVGSDQNNLKLSQGRADSVREYLVSQGIDPKKITALGKGESTPVAENTTAEGRANNRRVEIVIN